MHEMFYNKKTTFIGCLLSTPEEICLAALAIDVTSLEPYLSCGPLDNKAQGYALGSLAPNSNLEVLILPVIIK